MVSLIAATGLRIGELLALRWRASGSGDRDARGARVGLRGQFQAPKTQKALRTIPLGPHAIARAHRASGAGARGQAPSDSCSAIATGGPLRESKLLTNVLQPAAEAAGLGRVTWHQFRHIHSSLLNDLKRAGEDRAGATGTREHRDDAQHLHARRRCVAPEGDRGGRSANCSQVFPNPRIGSRTAHPRK